MADQTLRGSCLCGTVSYEVRPPFSRFVHCHCSRCRKATGSAHASNLAVFPDQFAWKSGQEAVTRFDLPTARSFATTFCNRCGSPLPRHTRDRTQVIIPAGSLDDEPGLHPQARIHWRSRSPWSCGSDDLPRYDEAFQSPTPGQPR